MCVIVVSGEYCESIRFEVVNVVRAIISLLILVADAFSLIMRFSLLGEWFAACCDLFLGCLRRAN